MEKDEHIARADDILEHYGIKGMKWGSRRGSRAKAAGKKAGHRTYDAKKLNNQELKKVVARMELEQKYTNLNKNTKGEGKKFADELIKSGGKTLFGIALTATAGKLLKDALESRMTKAAVKTVPKLVQPGKSFT